MVTKKGDLTFGLRIVVAINHERYHRRLDNLTTAYIYFGRNQTIL